MSIVQHVIDIPVNRDPRTFERHRRDMLTNLERVTGRHFGHQGSHAIFPYPDIWNDLLNFWVDSSWRSWDDEMRKLRRGMFALLPLEHLGLNRWYGPRTLVEMSGLIDKMEQHIQDLRERSGVTIPPVSGSVTDFMKDAYEVGDDGQVHFKVRFDAKGFTPEDINVKTTDDSLTVHAKKTTETDTFKSSKEFCRIVTLPRSIDREHLQCRLTEDGILMLEAPVRCPDYGVLTFNDDRQLGIRPHSDTQVQSAETHSALAVQGTVGPTVLEDKVKGRTLHVELPLDPIYKPEDLCVNVGSNRVVVSGKHFKMSGDRMSKAASVAEFEQSYEIPETVDPLSVTAQVIDRTLVLEAPLVKHHPVKQLEQQKEVNGTK